MSMLDIVHREVAKALQQARNVIRRAVISVAPGADFFLQTTGAGDDDSVDVELWQQFGFASRPPVDGEVLMVLPFGGEEGAIAVATTDRTHRPTDLAASEVVIYGLKAGAVQGQIRIASNGEINVIPGTGQVVNVGAAAGTEAALLGASFATKLAALNTAASAVPPAVTPPDAASINAIKAALVAFSTGSAALLATAAKVK